MAKQKKERKVKHFQFGTIEQETHHIHLWGRQFTKTTAIVTGVSGVVAFIVVIYALVAFTPLRRSIPGYPNESTKKTAVQTAIRLDSLEKVVTRWELYSENIRRVFAGEKPLDIDSLIRTGAERQTVVDEEIAAQDSLLRMQVMAQEQFELSGRTPRDLPLEGIHFFTPISGVVSQDFVVGLHPAIDITAPKNSNVCSILDGTVIFTGWSEEVGYTICIQHANDLVSIYKHNEKLLMEEGDKVTAGLPVAFLGGTGTLSTGDHLHFELWYKGEAVNPANYINF